MPSWTLRRPITDTARAFFVAVESGKGGAAASAYCTPGATFAAQAEPLTENKSLQAYAEWMRGLLTFMPDGRYEVRSFATDAERGSICAYAVFAGTHSPDGGPCPPTGKSMRTDYVYVMEFAGGKARDHGGWRYA